VDSSWNQWKHLLGTKIASKRPSFRAANINSAPGHGIWRSGRPHFRAASKSHCPQNIAEQIAEARQIHHRFGEFAEALDLIRARIESAPVERADLRKLCTELGIPADFDISLITWKRTTTLSITSSCASALVACTCFSRSISSILRRR